MARFKYILNYKDDDEKAEQRKRSAMRGLLLVMCGRLREEAFIDQPRSWVIDDPLDPRNAVEITVRKLYELADRPIEPEIVPEADEVVLAPRIPIHVAEARAMMAMLMLANGGCMYAGYAIDELELLPEGGAQIQIMEENGS